MFRGLPRYSRTRPSDFWESAVPASWDEMPGLAVLEENRRTNKGLVESQVLSLSYGKVIVKPVEKQRGLVPESYEGYQVLDPGDIVVRPTDLQNDQTSIRVGHVRDRGIITSAYIGLRPRGGWTDGYAFHYLAVVDSSKLIYGMGSGLRQQLGWGDLKRMPCLVPPVEEQAAIVKYLAHANARIDKAIAAKRRLVVLLREQAAAKRYDALGERDGRWPVRRLKTLLTRIDQGVSPQAENQLPKAEEWGVLKAGCVNGGLFRTDQIKRLPDDFDVPESLGIVNGDILVARASGSADLVGSAARVNGFQGRAILSDKIFRLVPKASVDPDYLVMAMNSYSYRQQVRAAISGAEGLANNLPVTALHRIVISIPPLEKQREIVANVAFELKTSSESTARTEGEIALLQEFRARLAADVVTGKVDVRAIAASLPDVAEPLDETFPELDDALEEVLGESEE